MWALSSRKLLYSFPSNHNALPSCSLKLVRYEINTTIIYCISNFLLSDWPQNCVILLKRCNVYQSIEYTSSFCSFSIYLVILEATYIFMRGELVISKIKFISKRKIVLALEFPIYYISHRGRKTFILKQ